MEEIQVTARMKIHDGKLDAFKTLAAKALQSVGEKDTGTRQYDWFLNADQSECVVRERFADSQAILDHAAHVGELLGPMTDVADMSMEFYGDPSPEVLETVAAFKPAVYSYFQGL